MNAAAVEARLEFLIGGQWSAVANHLDCRLAVQCGGSRTVVPRACAVAGRRSGHLSAVITPVQSEPRSTFRKLILNAGRLIKLFVVVDAEGKTILAYGHSQSPGLRWKKSSGNAGKDDRCA